MSCSAKYILIIAIVLGFGYARASAKLNLPPHVTCDTATADDIGAAAQYVSGFDAVHAGANPPLPQNISQIQDSDGLKAVALLQRALRPAKKEFLVRVCKDLTYIFFDRNASANISAVYAFWQKKSDVPAGTAPNRFISIPFALMQSVPKYSDYEQEVMRSLVQYDTAGPPFYTPTFTVTSGPDDQETALLAMIAHEMGHILGRRLLLTNNSNPGENDSDYGAVCHTTPQVQHFPDLTWLTPGQLSLHPFHNFGEDILGVHRYNEEYLTTMRGWLKTNNIGGIDGAVKVIYGQTNYPSLFGSLSGDEDVAETYKYHVLLRSAPTLSASLKLQTIATPIPIFTNLAGGNNGEKDKCIVDNEKTDD
jgi:hypothetical protein